MTDPDSSGNHPRHVAIVTGASRGVGLALARQLLARGARVLTLQRHPQAAAALGDGPLEQWACDLADPPAVAQRLQAWIAALPRESVSALSLINNAALMAPPGDLATGSDAHLSAAMRVGLEAPLLLSAAFLRASADFTVPRRLLHISSGLGRRAMAGASSYCASKAGLDHLSRVIALEEADKPNGARSVSMAPGIIDTDMQVQLRSADPARFSAQGMFAGFHANGQLDSPEGCAAKLLAYLERPDFGSQAVADLRDPG